ncbi:helicase C-terminal domain-containing protein [Lyngbya confervoides]|uniref:ATP-dependent DNA helicase n=1 Tax=Lyngbya confervoides BDU141951 TaxID=1574623 RepID=A0ABD4T2G3_9CYAN|nr:helicase C-terminal domain-containing protein [Lyngbya confervoides]MCM1982784.1 ATP-dependent DNA helicase [Lyngbya confervoides BDU141951]
MNHGGNVIEAQVHQQLYAFLKHQGEAHWPHHLTIARLVARALRLERSALLQVSPLAAYQGRYRLSYLASLLFSPQSAVVVAPLPILQQILLVEMQRFRTWTQTHKPLYRAQDWPGPSAGGILLLSPQEWLADLQAAVPRFPSDWPLILDGADQIETWTRQALTRRLTGQDWQQLLWAFPGKTAAIRDIQVALTHHIFQHPPNPYQAVVLDGAKQSLLRQLQLQLQPMMDQSPLPWRRFWEDLADQNHHGWVEINREQGQFTLYLAPTAVWPQAAALLQHRTAVLLGSSFGEADDALRFRQEMNLEDVTYVRFAAERQGEEIQLFLPDRIPMPNTAQFQSALLHQVQRFLLKDLAFSAQEDPNPLVLIVDDTPMKAQVASQLAASLGSRVVMETTPVPPHGLLICGWEFWLSHHQVLPWPRCFMVATLPIPSPEQPRVAARIAYYKLQRLDWFRLYLLPHTIQTLQRAIAPVRNRENGRVIIFDNRLLHRSYGQQILAALSPYARVESPDLSY